MRDMAHVSVTEDQILSLFVEGAFLSEGAIHRRMGGSGSVLRYMLNNLVSTGKLAAAEMPLGCERRFFLPHDEDTRRLARLIILY